jgi:integrase
MRKVNARRANEANKSQAVFTDAELGKLISAARKGRYGQRDATLILLMAHHGLRVSEAVDLEWDQIDFARAHLHVRRLKGGIASVHPIQGDELRALREVRRRATGAFVFASERDGGPMTRSNVRRLQLWLGHADIKHTAHYSELSAKPFKDFWK